MNVVMVMMVVMVVVVVIHVAHGSLFLCDHSLSTHGQCLLVVFTSFGTFKPNVQVDESAGTKFVDIALDVLPSVLAGRSKGQGSHNKKMNICENLFRLKSETSKTKKEERIIVERMS